MSQLSWTFFYMPNVNLKNQHYKWDPSPSGISQGPDGLEAFCSAHSRGNTMSTIFDKPQTPIQVYHLNLTFPLEDYDEYYQACPGG